VEQVLEDLRPFSEARQVVLARERPQVLTRNVVITRELEVPVS
jgi:hypothetical protein